MPGFLTAFQLNNFCQAVGSPFKTVILLRWRRMRACWTIYKQNAEFYHVQLYIVLFQTCRFISLKMLYSAHFHNIPCTCRPKRCTFGFKPIECMDELPCIAFHCGILMKNESAHEMAAPNAMLIISQPPANSIECQNKMYFIKHAQQIAIQLPPQSYSERFSSTSK